MILKWRKKKSEYLNTREIKSIQKKKSKSHDHHCTSEEEMQKQAKVMLQDHICLQIFICPIGACTQPRTKEKRKDFVSLIQVNEQVCFNKNSYHQLILEGSVVLTMADYMRRV